MINWSKILIIIRLAGSHSSKDCPSNVSSHGRFRCHIWLHSKNNIYIVYDDVSFLYFSRIIISLSICLYCEEFSIIFLIFYVFHSRTDGRAQCGLWMFSCVISAILTTTVLVFSIRRTLKLLLTYQGTQQRLIKVVKILENYTECLA